MIEKKVESHIFVVFGATGDLMQRSIVPALYQLTKNGHLKNNCLILGAARNPEVNDKSFRKMAREAFTKGGIELKNNSNAWCDDCLFYQSIGDEKEENFAALSERIRQIEEKHNFPGNRIFYLATPPTAFPTTIEMLGKAGLNKSRGWTRLVIEKPFGRDLESAQKLNKLVHRHFKETQIYRIDHYLGKETVQNLLICRFANPIFESLWNRDRIQNVRITVAEDSGIGKRAGYFDRAGVLRDMIQNHLTQLLTLTAMEVPAKFDVDSIRTEKIKVLKSVAPISKDHVIFGQYSEGKINGKKVPGYLKEQGVAPGSKTETFVGMRINIANWRWHGVPFFLRTGKRLPSRLTQIVINFRRPPVSVFDPLGGSEVKANSFVITLQPDEGFDLCFEMKALGEPLKIETQRLHFRYAEAFAPLPDAYQTLLLDIMSGDQTLFVSADEVEESWRLYTPIIEQNLPVYPYPAGTWGPPETKSLFGEANGID